MNNRRLALLLVILAAGCGAPVIPATPGASALTAQGTPTVPAPSVPSADPAAAAEVQALLGRMTAAVLAGDRDAYLALVDLSDPVFAVEQERWAIDWSDRNPVTDYTLEVAGLEQEGDLATGMLTVIWELDPERSAEPWRITTYVARFTRGADGWRYGGEAWASTAAEHFVVRVAPGLEATVPGIVGILPDIFDDVTAELGYEPTGALEIKLYANANALVANTLLSLPTIRGWNEPGEALKLVHDPGGPPLGPTIAHELTHFIGFDRAGTHRTRMPWWLDEGIATYVASTIDDTNASSRLAQVIDWEADGTLAPWGEMTVFEETPLELWQYVYPQGYAMVRFVTEEYGVVRRNAWLAAMATEMDIDEATPAELGRTFDELDAEFRDWLAAQR